MVKDYLTTRTKRRERAMIDAERLTNPASGAAKARERPILFSGENVCAILDGRKSMTRRVDRPQPDSVAAFQDGQPTEAYYGGWPKGGYAKKLTCPFGQPGDRLWVRETFKLWPNGEIFFAATPAPEKRGKFIPLGNWKSSISMPRWASRITLEITAVRVERLKDITVGDAQDEGVTPIGIKGDGRRWRAAFRELWDSLNAKRGYGWENNPFVWAISFRRLP